MYVIIRYYHKQSYCLLEYTEPNGLSYTSLRGRIVIVREYLATDTCIYNPTKKCREDVVIVACNYPLSAYMNCLW